MRKNSYYYNKRWREKHPSMFRDQKCRVNKRYNHRYPERIRFARKVARLIQGGYISRQPCQKCGSVEQVQACQLTCDPYNPLWLCDRHNKELHREIKECQQ